MKKLLLSLLTTAGLCCSVVAFADQTSPPTIVTIGGVTYSCTTTLHDDGTATMTCVPVYFASIDP